MNPGALDERLDVQTMQRPSGIDLQDTGVQSSYAEVSDVLGNRDKKSAIRSPLKSMGRTMASSTEGGGGVIPMHDDNFRSLLFSQVDVGMDHERQFIFGRGTVNVGCDHAD